MKVTNHHLNLILQKSISEIISESRMGYLGILWWFLEPILYLAVFYLIFVVLFKRGDENAIAFLLIGLVSWKWFDAAIRQSAVCIKNSQGIMLQVYLPKIIFPAIAVLTATIKFLIVFLILLVFLMVVGYLPSLSWLAIPVIVFTQLLLIFSLGGILATFVPLVPDLRLIIDNGLKLMFFLSGIFFDISKVPSELQVYLNINPMIGIIKSYRMILIEGNWPDWNFLYLLILISVFLSVLVWLFLGKFDQTYAKII